MNSSMPRACAIGRGVQEGLGCILTVSAEYSIEKAEVEIRYDIEIQDYCLVSIVYTVPGGVYGATDFRDSVEEGEMTGETALPGAGENTSHKSLRIVIGVSFLLDIFTL